MGVVFHGRIVCAITEPITFLECSHVFLVILFGTIYYIASTMENPLEYEFPKNNLT